MSYHQTLAKMPLNASSGVLPSTALVGLLFERNTAVHCLIPKRVGQPLCLEHAPCTLHNSSVLSLGYAILLRSMGSCLLITLALQNATNSVLIYAPPPFDMSIFIFFPDCFLSKL
ncbi:hypothetical protein O6H91_Y019300 [Diphasiastrum complanatum]|nr:hypothetical protein O6H91_Y019300 [Diphasiastrum complanatum]